MPAFSHPQFSRRTALQAGAVGLLGLGIGELRHLRAGERRGAGERPGSSRPSSAKSVIYVFLSGGLAQHESFDPKPDAPAEVRGEFGTIPTTAPGVRIIEHLPRLAARFDRWAVA